MHMILLLIMIYDDSDNDSLVMDVIDHVCIYIYIYMYA